MSRGLWFVVGAGAGVYAMLRARRAAETFTPEGFSDRVASLGAGAQLFADEVRAGMAEKETELRERLLPPEEGPPALEGGKHARRIDDDHDPDEWDDHHGTDMEETS